MKTFTVRFAHLENRPHLSVGQIIFEGDKIGRMGNSGSSTADHLHIDVIEMFVKKIIRLKEIGYESGHAYNPNVEQLNYFIDAGLFKTQIHITSYFYDPDYKLSTGKHHPAYDVVPKNRKETDNNFDIFWNRSKTGVVLKTGFDNGYGNYVLIGFES